MRLVLLMAAVARSFAWQWPRSALRVRRRGATTVHSDARLVSSFDSDDDEGAVATMDGGVLPKLVVFDLDHTLWTPELYKLRRLEGYETAAPPGPTAGEDVRLFPGAAAVLEELATSPKWRGTTCACASRTNKGPWARSLLQQFAVGGGTLSGLLRHKEIYTGTKTKHFAALREASGVGFEDMLFFDDARDGKFGNCEIVSGLGVMSVHSPDGLTEDLWAHALETYATKKGAGAAMGVVVDAPGSAAGGGEVSATVATWKPDKGFGFAKVGGKDVFFHKSALVDASAASKVAVGADVFVRLGKDARGRAQCDSVAFARAGGADADVLTVPCFSMNMPFAGLVAHGRKTVETRNHTMFAPFEGKTLALHVGRRTYPDGGVHRQILAAAGADDAEIDRLTSLPSGFSRGSVVALVDVGATTLVEDEAARADPAVESSVVATGKAMGRYLTTLSNPRFLAAPVAARGQPGVFTAALPRALLADEDLQ